MLDVVEDSLLPRLTAVVHQTAHQHSLRGPISETVALVDAGFSSMAMVDLMLALEVEFDIAIPQGEMTPENFRSIVSLSSLIGRL